MGLNFRMTYSCVWDLEKGKREVEFDAHDGDVVSMSLSPDGKQFVTGSVDKTAKLWDVRATEPKQTFWGHDADVNSVCVSRKVSIVIKKKGKFVINLVPS